MDKYRFLLEIDGKQIEFTCEDDTKDFKKFLDYAYEEFSLDKEAEIRVLEKEMIK